MESASDKPTQCPCGGVIHRWEATLVCRDCGTVYAMFLSAETRSPAKYQLHETSSVRRTLPRLQATV